LAKKSNSYYGQFEEELSEDKLGKSNKTKQKQQTYKSELLLICDSKNIFESSIVSSIRKHFSKTQHGMVHGEPSSGYLIGLVVKTLSLKKKAVSFDYVIKKKHRAKTNTALFMIQNSLAKEFLIPCKEHKEIESPDFYPEFGSEEILIELTVGAYGRYSDDDLIQIADRIGCSIVECFDKFITSSI